MILVILAIMTVCDDQDDDDADDHVCDIVLDITTFMIMFMIMMSVGISNSGSQDERHYPLVLLSFVLSRNNAALVSCYLFVLSP